MAWETRCSHKSSHPRASRAQAGLVGPTAGTPDRDPENGPWCRDPEPSRLGPRSHAPLPTSRTFPAPLPPTFSFRLRKTPPLPTAAPHLTPDRHSHPAPDPGPTRRESRPPAQIRAASPNGLRAPGTQRPPGTTPLPRPAPPDGQAHEPTRSSQGAAAGGDLSNGPTL